MTARARWLAAYLRAVTPGDLRFAAAVFGAAALDLTRPARRALYRAVDRLDRSIP